MSPRIVILTGSGLSAESDIPTFRDANGLWKNHRIEEVASPVAFRLNPALVHEFYDMRRRAARATEPNAAHDAMARLARGLGPDVMIVTQNVDDLHERAGSDDVIHLHGELNKARCTACGRRWVWEVDLGGNPACPGCRQRALRPDIVWFGENVYHLDEVHDAVDSCELFVAIGTSGVVQPAAGLATRAQGHRARTLLLNLEGHGDGARFDEVRLGPASSIVPAWVKEILDEFEGDGAGEYPRSEEFHEWIRQSRPELDRPQSFQLFSSGALDRLSELIDLLSEKASALTQALPDDPLLSATTKAVEEAVFDLRLAGDLAFKHSTRVYEPHLTRELKDGAERAWRYLRGSLYWREFSEARGKDVTTPSGSMRNSTDERSNARTKAFTIGGEQANLVGFEFFGTYEGFVEGYPGPGTNGMVRNLALERAQKLSPGVRVHTFEPELRRAPAGFCAPEDWEELPAYCCIGRFKSMWDELILVWFQDELPLRMGTSLADRVQKLPWDKLATVVRTSYDDF